MRKLTEADSEITLICPQQVTGFVLTSIQTGKRTEHFRVRIAKDIFNV